MKATPRMHTYGKLPAKITINSEQHGAQWGFSDKKAQKPLLAQHLYKDTKQRR